MSLEAWKIFASKTSAIEKKYLPEVHKAILKAYASFLSDLKQYGLEQATANLQRLALNDDLIPVLTGIYSKAGVLGAAMTANELKKASRQKAANIGRNETWIAAVLNYLKLNILEFAAKISETTREDILKIVSRGVEEGKGAEEIARELMSSEIPLARAKVIVRTESIRSFNAGSVISAQSFPYEVNKQWHSALDERTRKAHSHVNGHVTSEHGTFKVPIYKNNVLIGYDEMLHPGDPKAHPSNTINCRCRIVFEPKRTADGKLIPRRNNTPVMTVSSPARSMVVA